jgi:hypothetical protein
MCGGSCQVFGPKVPGLTLVQDNLDGTVCQQWAKAAAHVASPGVCPSQADALHAFIRQVDAPQNGPDLLDQPHDAVLEQQRRVRGKPLSCPEQHIMG